MKVDVSIGENFFAPKCMDRNENFDFRNSHAIANSKCNFSCGFCKYAVKTERKPNYMEIKDFRLRVLELMKKGNMFKFTGGEPCLNIYLEEELHIVKQNNGIVFLDTNGSLPNVIEKLLKKNLVDVLGVSLKGLTSEEAIITSGVENETLCWNNVLKTIKIATHYNVRTIVTYVAYDDFDYNKLCEFAKILDSIGDNIFLKVNNLCGNKYKNMKLKALENDILPKMVLKFVDENPKWKNRVILINSSEGVTDYSKILFV